MSCCRLVDLRGLLDCMLDGSKLRAVGTLISGLWEGNDDSSNQEHVPTEDEDSVQDVEDGQDVAVSSRRRELFADLFVVKEGWLWKQGSHWKTWKKRYFRLKEQVLYYFEDTKSPQCLGLLVLNDAIFAATGRYREGCEIFAITSGDRKLSIHVDPPAKAEEGDWKAALTQNIRWKDVLITRFDSQLVEREQQLHLLRQQKQQAQAEKDLAYIKAAEMEEKRSQASKLELEKWKGEVDELKKLLDESESRKEIADLESRFKGLEGQVVQLKEKAMQDSEAYRMLEERNEELDRKLGKLTSREKTQSPQRAVIDGIDEVSTPDKEMDVTSSAASELARQLGLCRAERKVLIKEVKRLRKLLAQAGVKDPEKADLNESDG
eukprot:g54795.t1